MGTKRLRASCLLKRLGRSVSQHSQASREFWTAYIGIRTALRKHDAAVALLESTNASYSASLDAYKYGVKNLVDVVTAEKQLAQARLSSVSARSELFLKAVNLEFATGNLLRNQPPAMSTQLRTDLSDYPRQDVLGDPIQSESED